MVYHSLQSAMGRDKCSAYGVQQVCNIVDAVCSVEVGTCDCVGVVL